jgi:major vault protein
VNVSFLIFSPEEAAKIFQVPDFVGDATKAIASRVRGAVAAHTFDTFHKNSATLIRKAVFGTDEAGNIRNRFQFTSNNLVITNIDIQSVEPVDQRTRDALQKSVQLAIEITTKSQEAAARHEAERREQEARGRLERQKINDEAEAEKARTELLRLKAQSAVVESSGQATAEAKARAEAACIEGEAAVQQAQHQAEAARIKAESEIEQLRAKQEAEISHKKALNELEISKARDLAAIESNKFAQIVDAIGTFLHSLTKHKHTPYIPRFRFILLFLSFFFFSHSTSSSITVFIYSATLLFVRVNVFL